MDGIITPPAAPPLGSVFPHTTAADANEIRFRVFFRALPRSRSIANAALADGGGDAADRAFAEARYAAYSAFVAAETDAFLWHKHGMHFAVARTGVDTCGAVRGFCLEGVTAVGDAIEDEWVVTWLLMRLTTQFASDDAIVQVNDTDGEFLLIESADALPNWVSPENSANRVYVRAGAVHLVPLTVVPEFGQDTFNNPDELRRARRRGHSSKKDEVKRVYAASLRAVAIGNAPTKASSAIQNAIRHKLSEVPQYMRANRHRMRCLLPVRAAHVLSARSDIVGAAVEAFYYREPREAMAICSRMTAFPPSSGCVERMVTMTRCQYAQAKQQHFFPPKPFQHLPGIDLVGKSMQLAHPDAAATEMGVKLACGLELLIATDATEQHGRAWRDIVDEACERFTPDSVVADVTEPDDDDGWLYMHPDTLEEKLHRAAARVDTHDDGHTGDQERDIAQAGGAEELQDIASMFNNFVSGISGIDGVQGDEQVQLDMGAFMKILNGELGASATSHPHAGQDDAWDVDDSADDDEDDDQDSEVDSDDELDDTEVSITDGDVDEPDREDDDERIMREAMEEMDAELSDSTLQKTFTHVEPVEGNVTDDTEKPLDLDFHLLSNLLESFASQDGAAGPVSTILHELSRSS